MDLSNWILALVGAGGGGALVAFGIIRTFGQKWLDSKFAGRLQDLRHEHERQMERARLEGSRALDRSAKLAEREFEVSAEAWSLVHEAYVRTMTAMPGFKTYPDLSRAEDKIASHVAKGAGFDGLEIEELLSKPRADRNSYYQERKEAHQMGEAQRAVQAATHYLAKKALFLEKGLHRQLSEFVDAAWFALIDWDLVKELRGDRHALMDIKKRRDKEFKRDGEAKIKALEQFVRERFWGGEAATALASVEKPLEGTREGAGGGV